MKNNRRRSLLMVVPAILLLPVLFYGGFEFAANRIVKNYELPRQARNSVKHALTASAIFRQLRQIHVSDAAAEYAVLFLGDLNEHLETYVKVGKHDSEAEMRKDLYNNWAGLVAARWMLTQPEPRDLGSTMAVLVASQTLMLEPIQLTSPANPEISGVSGAQEWLLPRKQQFAVQITDVLNSLAPPSQR